MISILLLRSRKINYDFVVEISVSGYPEPTKVGLKKCNSCIAEYRANGLIVRNLACGHIFYVNSDKFFLFSNFVHY